MLFLLSPAKTFSDDLVNPLQKTTEPLFASRSSELIKILEKKSPTKIARLMKLSENLSHLNYQRYQDWSPEHTKENSSAAIFRFYGDVYKGLQSASFSGSDTEYAQEHLGVLSGLYGFLRPLDLMQDYRLEMGTHLKNSRGKNLYDFWSDTVTDYLNNHSADILVNLASKEYDSVINMKKLKKPMLNIVFKEKKDEKYRIVAIYAKHARGLFAGWAIKNRVEKLEDLKKFNEEGYSFDISLSTPESFVFVR